MRDAERSRGAMVTAAMTMALLGAALWLPWFEYDFNSGRQTAPDGPYADDPMVETAHTDYRAFAVEGDTRPSDPERADQLMTAVGALTAAAIFVLLPVFIGEIRRLRRIISRRVALSFTLFALACTLVALAIVWYWIPGTMEGQRVDDAFTHRLDEPSGYTRTGVSYAWIAAGLSLATTAATWLFTFQAGSHDPAMVEAHRVEA